MAQRGEGKPHEGTKRERQWQRERGLARGREGECCTTLEREREGEGGRVAEEPRVAQRVALQGGLNLKAPVVSVAACSIANAHATAHAARTSFTTGGALPPPPASTACAHRAPGGEIDQNRQERGAIGIASLHH